MRKFRAEPGKGIVASKESITSSFEKLRCKSLQDAIDTFAKDALGGDASRVCYQEIEEGIYDLWVRGHRVGGPGGRYNESDSSFRYSIKSSKNLGDYKGYTLYEGDYGVYIYTSPKGKGKKEFTDEKEAREYIDSVKSASVTASVSNYQLYRNTRNENKYIEVKKLDDGHTYFRQFLYWNMDTGPVKNYTGSKTNRGRYHRVTQNTLKQVLEDYTPVDDVHTEQDTLDIFSSVQIIYPWKMVGQYADDFEAEVGGFDEEDCMTKLIDLQEKHGELTWYSGYSDEDYEAGEYIGRDNFIYSSAAPLPNRCFGLFEYVPGGPEDGIYADKFDLLEVVKAPDEASAEKILRSYYGEFDKNQFVRELTEDEISEYNDMMTYPLIDDYVESATKSADTNKLLLKRFMNAIRSAEFSVTSRNGGLKVISPERDEAFFCKVSDVLPVFERNLADYVEFDGDDWPAAYDALSDVAENRYDAGPAWQFNFWVQDMTDKYLGPSKSKKKVWPEELTYSEYSEGDQIVEGFVSVLDELDLLDEPSAQGGHGTDYIYRNSDGSLVLEMDLDEQTDLLTDMYNTSTSKDDFLNKIRTWLQGYLDKLD